MNDNSTPISRHLTRIVGVAVAVILTVVACGSSPAGGAPTRECAPDKPCIGDEGVSWYVKHVNVEGRDVVCIVVRGSTYSATSLSCDWSPR